jgi:hypothetical protein
MVAFQNKPFRGPRVVDLQLNNIQKILPGNEQESQCISKTCHDPALKQLSHICIICIIRMICTVFCTKCWGQTSMSAEQSTMVRMGGTWRTWGKPYPLRAAFQAPIGWYNEGAISHRNLFRCLTTQLLLRLSTPFPQKHSHFVSADSYTS